MAKRLNADTLLEDNIITLHLQSAETEEEQEMLEELECRGEYRKTLCRTKKLVEWYRIWKVVKSTSR